MSNTKDATNRFNADRVKALHIARKLVAQLEEPSSDVNWQQAGDMTELAKTMRMAAHWAGIKID